MPDKNANIFKRLLPDVFVDMLFTQREAGAFPVKDLSGKTVVFTGGTDGMGKIAAQHLASQGAKIYLLGRDENKTRSAVDAINQLTGNQYAEYIPCDLASLESVRQAAAIILESNQPIDLLVNCAGANIFERKESADGFELCLATNYFGPYLLTTLLLDQVKAANDSRIVNVSSAMQSRGHIFFDDFQLEKNWSAGNAYAQAKLALNMWTVALAKQLKQSESSTTVNAVNPGFIHTNLLRDTKGAMKLFNPIMEHMASPPEVGAERVLQVALSEEYASVSGKYVYENHVKDPNPEALDDEKIERLWGLSQKIVAGT